MKGTGYRYWTELVSSWGERRILFIPGRRRDAWRSKAVIVDRFGMQTQEMAERRDRQFRRLLSAGWKVVGPTSPEKFAAEEQQRKSDPKGIDKVVGTTKTGSASHGGDHASGEVPDSPNKGGPQGQQGEKGTAKGDGGAKQQSGSGGGRKSDDAKNEGKKNSRGCRGGQKLRRHKAARKTSGDGFAVVQNCAKQGGGSVYCPQPLRNGRAVSASALESAELLTELVGRSQVKTLQGVEVNSLRLLTALETGDNPLPPLEAPKERPKVRVLITPDCSGSCQGWSGVGQAWAMHLSNLPDVEVVYLTNSNGEFYEIRDVENSGAWSVLLEKIDLVIYLGDGDGRQMCEQYARKGATVLSLDCYCAFVANPRAKSFVEGRLCWVDRVSAKDPATWAQAVKVGIATLK